MHPAANLDPSVLPVDVFELDGKAGHHIVCSTPHPGQDSSEVSVPQAPAAQLLVAEEQGATLELPDAAGPAATPHIAESLLRHALRTMNHNSCGKQQRNGFIDGFVHDIAKERHSHYPALLGLVAHAAWHLCRQAAPAAAFQCNARTACPLIFRSVFVAPSLASCAHQPSHICPTPAGTGRLRRSWPPRLPPGCAPGHRRRWGCGSW